MSKKKTILSNAIIPCQRNSELRKFIDDYAEALLTHGHKLGDHGLNKSEFDESGIFRGAVEKIRGMFSATIKHKKALIAAILDFLVSQGRIAEWVGTGTTNRYDVQVELLDGEIAVIEMKGCLDGNNTTIFERPAHASEFVVWSICQNPGADPRHNVWSGIHTRLSAEIIERQQVVDGVIVWDMLCGTVARPCPKFKDSKIRATSLATYQLPPPCIYLFPRTIPTVRNNPKPAPQRLKQVRILELLHEVFGGEEKEITQVYLSVTQSKTETLRTTKLVRGGVVIVESDPTPIRRR